MIQDLLALGWWEIFWFGIKAISAWAVAGICVMLPIAIPLTILKAIAGD